MLAMVHYRSESEFTRRFRRRSRGAEDMPLTPRFDIEEYLLHHGKKLARRFDANSYRVLNQMMDLHDVGRGRGGIEKALSRVQAPVLTGETTSDFLYLPAHQRQLASTLAKYGASVHHARIHSDNGHDAFITEAEQVGRAIGSFLQEVALRFERTRIISSWRTSGMKHRASIRR